MVAAKEFLLRSLPDAAVVHVAPPAARCLRMCRIATFYAGAAAIGTDRRR
jgi:hypothetical protein